MPIADIPRDEWLAFLYGFMREHRGALVTLEVFDLGSGGYVQARDLPLEEVSLSTEAGATITIVVRESPDEQVRQVIARSKRLVLDRLRDGTDRALEIESSDGRTVIVRLEAPFRLLAVDAAYP